MPAKTDAIGSKILIRAALREAEDALTRGLKYISYLTPAEFHEISVIYNEIGRVRDRIK